MLALKSGRFQYAAEMESPIFAPALATTAWADWQPQERAVLCFIVTGGRVLLIHKKRGLGAGKVNAPGGKIEPGESALTAAVRETQEEVGGTPLDLAARGELRFQFTNGYALHCTVFVARSMQGEPRETDEAAPFWRAVEAIPYDQMWEDDQHWLPQVLAGRTVDASFTFDEEKMLEKRISFGTPEAEA